MNRTVFLLTVLGALSGLLFGVTAQRPAGGHEGRHAGFGYTKVIGGRAELNGRMASRLFYATTHEARIDGLSQVEAATVRARAVARNSATTVGQYE
jgi:hypothetical protein